MHQILSADTWTKVVYMQKELVHTFLITPTQIGWMARHYKVMEWKEPESISIGQRSNWYTSYKIF